MPLPLASAARIAASLVASILARPIGLPLLVPFSRPGDTRGDALLNDRALELGEHPEHLEQRASGRGGCVNHLLLEIQIAPGGVEFAQKADEVLQ
jgi:hypothetical protein